MTLPIVQRLFIPLTVAALTLTIGELNAQAETVNAIPPDAAIAPTLSLKGNEAETPIALITKPAPARTVVSQEAALLGDPLVVSLPVVPTFEVTGSTELGWLAQSTPSTSTPMAPSSEPTNTPVTPANPAPSDATPSSSPAGTTESGTTAPGTTAPGTTVPSNPTTTPGTTGPGSTPDSFTPSPTTPDTTPTTPQTAPTSTPAQPLGPTEVAPGRSTRSGSSYVGVGGNIGIGSGDTELGQGSFAVISKIGLTRDFSVRPSILFSDSVTILVPVTYDFNFGEGPTQTFGFRAAPYVGVGAAISTGDGADVGLLLTGGIDVPLSAQFTATAAVNASVTGEAAVGILIGIGYNFSGF